MGFFDRFAAKKPAHSAPVAPAGDSPPLSSEPKSGNYDRERSDDLPIATTPSPITGVKSRLAAVREKVEAKDLPGAMAIYEELLASSGDRADVLVGISGVLGSFGHVAEIIELVAPRYDADRHGPATGLNLLQAYL